MTEREAVAIVSGGVDSVTVAYLLVSEGYSPPLLSVDYSPRRGRCPQLSAGCRRDARRRPLHLSRLRPEFVEAFEAMQKRAVEGFGNPSLRLYVPIIHKTKAEIVEIGAELGVPYEDTWSCYEGGELHCVHCGTCQERREAFELAG